MLIRLDRPIEAGIGLSPDGQDLYYGQIDHSGSDLMLINDFWK